MIYFVSVGAKFQKSQIWGMSVEKRSHYFVFYKNIAIIERVSSQLLHNEIISFVIIISYQIGPPEWILQWYWIFFSPV